MELYPYTPCMLGLDRVNFIFTFFFSLVLAGRFRNIISNSRNVFAVETRYFLSGMAKDAIFRYVFMLGDIFQWVKQNVNRYLN